MYLSFSGFLPRNRHSRPLPLGRIVRVCTLIACAGLIAIAASLLWQARAVSLRTAQATTNNLVSILTQHTERTIDSVDMLLKVVARDLGPHPEDPVKRSELKASLSRIVQDLPHVTAVRLLDPQFNEPLFEFFRGKPADRTADKEAVEVHTQNRFRGLHVGTPYFDKLSQHWAVSISRRVSGQEGVPGRVVLAVLNLEYLHNFYQSIDMGSNGSISIIRTDGIMIARRPFDPSYLGRDVSKALYASTGNRVRGNYEISAVTDGITRIYGFQRLNRVPMVVTAGLSKDTILAKWAAEAKRGMGIAIIAALILLVLGELLARVASHRDRMEREMRHAATHDALTGLSNRTSFQRQLDCTLERATREELCLLLIDLDEFKTVNDTLGHDAGDALLREAAMRLREIAPGRHDVARLGGDEFAVVIDGPVTVAADAARRVLDEFRRPFQHDGQTVMTAASVGITSFPEHGETASDLLKNADIALYAAKGAGRNRFSVFEQDMRSSILKRIALHEDIRASLDADLFVPFYQPQICVHTGDVLGFEALARWRHPERGLLTPAVFGSAFENHDLAIDVGRHLLRQILDDVCDWRDQGLEFGRIAINAAAGELDHPHFAGHVLKELKIVGIPPELIEIEVTEGVLFGKTVDRVQANLLRLHNAGVRIALDDFGTGYASLTHLKQFPIGVLKIDRSFVHNVENNAADASIVTAVIDMAHGLRIAVVAEGVERPYQLDFLRRAGCTAGQGYLFAKPMAGSRVPAFLRTNYTRMRPGRYEASA